MHMRSNQLKHFIACTLFGLVGLATPSLADQAIYCTYELNGSASTIFSGSYASGLWLSVDQELIERQAAGSAFKLNGHLFEVEQATANQIMDACQTAVLGADPRARFLQARTPYYSYYSFYVLSMLRPTDGYPVIFENAQGLVRIDASAMQAHTLQSYLASVQDPDEAVVVISSDEEGETDYSSYYRMSHSADYDPDFLFDLTSDMLPIYCEGKFDVVIFESLPYDSWGMEQFNHALTNAYRLLKKGGRLFSNQPLHQLHLESELDYAKQTTLVQLPHTKGLKFSPDRPAVAYVANSSKLKDSNLLAQAFHATIGRKLNEMGMNVAITEIADKHWKSARIVTEKFYKATKR